MSDDQPKARGVQFDPRVDLGHILSFLGFMVAGFIGWMALDKRVVVLEENRHTQVQIDRHQDEMSRQQMNQIKESLNELKTVVNKINDRLEEKR